MLCECFGSKFLYDLFAFYTCAFLNILIWIFVYECGTKDNSSGLIFREKMYFSVSFLVWRYKVMDNLIVFN